MSLSNFFTDPGADTWTCTIRWGDENVTTLEACDPASTVSNTYRSAGSYRVRITVQETAPGAAVGGGQLQVTVRAGGKPGQTPNTRERQ